MSKYDNLWRWIAENNQDTCKLTYARIAELAGVPIDHSFLKYKKELTAFGFQVSKISMKEETVVFERITATPSEK